MPRNASKIEYRFFRLFEELSAEKLSFQSNESVSAPAAHVAGAKVG